MEIKNRQMPFIYSGRFWAILLYTIAFLVDAGFTLATWSKTRHIELNLIYQATGHIWPVLLLNVIVIIVLWWVWPKAGKLGQYLISYWLAWVMIARGTAVYNFIWNIKAGMTEADAVAMTETASQVSQSLYSQLGMAYLVLAFVAFFTYWLFTRDWRLEKKTI